uniref:Ig-like domain-containing protein n=1 Tax=Varanus komodoensis TaxID=61221 RepID=A0A8D2JIY5_VARKO
ANGGGSALDRDRAARLEAVGRVPLLRATDGQTGAWEKNSLMFKRSSPRPMLDRLCVNTAVGAFAEPPKMKLTRKAGQDDTETLPCWAHGFYPREIDMAWTRDGEVWLPDTFRGVLAPNSDGTYHAWVGIRIDPAERGRFRCRCRVKHDGLQNTLDKAWNEFEVASSGQKVTALAVGIFNTPLVPLSGSQLLKCLIERNVFGWCWKEINVASGNSLGSLFH